MGKEKERHERPVVIGTGIGDFGLTRRGKSTAQPDLTHPGRAEVQQKRALRYDPYPETGMGTDMSELRPREYQNPPAEPSQARWNLDQATNAGRWGTQGRD